MWLLLAIGCCLISLSTAGRPPIRHPKSTNSNDDSNRQYNNYNDNNYNGNNYNGNNYNYNKQETTTGRQVPLELHLNFTFPENGLPPLKLNMGVVSQYLNEMSEKINYMNGSFVPQKMKKTLLVNITNPNKPLKPIPSEVFAAGLPKGALIPGDVVKPCRNFIVSTCNALCRVQLRSCSFLCDGRRDCLTSCETSLKTCSSFCDSTFSQLDDLLKLPGKGVDGVFDLMGNAENATTSSLLDEFKNEIPNVNFYLSKCLQNCGSNTTCVAQCHHVCHNIWQKPTLKSAALQDSQTLVRYANPSVPIDYPIPASPVSSYSVGSQMRDADDDSGDATSSNDNGEQQKDDTLDTVDAQL